MLHVTYEQFTRALTKLGLNMPAICFKILARKYMDKNNTREINYDRFLKEVDYEHAKGASLRPGLTLQSSQGLGESQLQGGLGQAGSLAFTTDQVSGANTAPGLNGAGWGAAGPGNARVNVNLNENQAKGRFDSKAGDKHDEIYAMGHETENAKNKDKLTALGNSQLKVLMN